MNYYFLISNFSNTCLVVEVLFPGIISTDIKGIFIYRVLILIILQINSFLYDCLVMFLFLTNDYFSGGLQLHDYSSNRGAYWIESQYYIGKRFCNV